MVTMSEQDQKKEKALALDFLPTNMLCLIPRRLFENVRGRVLDTRTIDRIYQCANQAASPSLSCFFILMERTEHEIHGVLWIKLDPIEQEVCVHLFSVDPEYDDGGWVERTTRWLYEHPLPGDVGSYRVSWLWEDANEFGDLNVKPALSQRIVFNKEGICGHV